MNTKNIHKFLLTKNINWHNFEVWDAKTASFRTATDKDFNGDFVTLLNCIDAKKEFYYETYVMVSNYKFYIYEDGLIAQDLSDDWQEYLLTHTKGYAKYLYLKYEQEKQNITNSRNFRVSVLQNKIDKIQTDTDEELKKINALQKALSKGFDALDVEWIINHKNENINKL